MPFDKHVDISAPCILSDSFIKCLLDVLSRDDMTFRRQLLESLQDFFFLFFAQTAMIPAIFASHEFFKPALLVLGNHPLDLRL